MKLALLLSLAALCLEAAAGAGFWLLSDATYSYRSWLGEEWGLPLTYAGLVLAGPLALLCAGWAAARWLHRVRTWVALPVVLVLCLPALLVAVMTSFTLGCLQGWC